LQSKIAIIADGADLRGRLPRSATGLLVHAVPFLARDLVLTGNDLDPRAALVSRAQNITM
jgi:hypothetical protein